MDRSVRFTCAHTGKSQTFSLRTFSPLDGAGYTSVGTVGKIPESKVVFPMTVICVQTGREEKNLSKQFVMTKQTNKAL